MPVYMSLTLDHMKIQAFISIKVGKNQVICISGRISIVVNQSIIGGRRDDGNVADDRI